MTFVCSRAVYPTILCSSIVFDICKLQGSVAYVPQQAWMQNATLKDNVLFGKTEEQCMYYKVLRCCALEKDLEMLPGADQTEIGEKVGSP